MQKCRNAKCNNKTQTRVDIFMHIYGLLIIASTIPLTIKTKTTKTKTKPKPQQGKKASNGPKWVKASHNVPNSPRHYCKCTIYGITGEARD